MSVPVDLTGRTALVTGGAGGIGRACAERLARAGAAVVVLDRDADGAAMVAAAIGGRSIGIDLTDTDAVDRLDVSADILVNNAGFQHVAPLEEFPPEVFRTMLALSAYVTAKHGLEGLSKVIAMEGAAHGVTSNCVNHRRIDHGGRRVERALSATGSPRPSRPSGRRSTRRRRTGSPPAANRRGR
jgi:3-hydroxybutyrate dehydrogenase